MWPGRFCPCKTVLPIVRESLPALKRKVIVDRIQKNAFHYPDIPAGVTSSKKPDLGRTTTSETSTASPVLVSACLAGRPCRFDGRHKKDDRVAELVALGGALPVCPEVEGGLPTPRRPAEIVGGDGHDVLAGRARVVTADGRDVTDAYLDGARAALEAAEDEGATLAILKARSPSCGCGDIYDGTHCGTLVNGIGVTAALLQDHGITVITEEELPSRAKSAD
jgi:uncharacterized protein YbbK (DUF523 family)